MQGNRLDKLSISILNNTLATASIMALITTSASGSGFALIEQSASQMGHSFAGGSAIADDASTIYFNPAGLTRVPHQFIAGAHLINTSAKFSGTGTTAGGAFPTTGGNGGDAGGLGEVPNLYYALPLMQDTVFGIGISVPFGLSTEYNDGWKGRYLARQSDVRTININPSVGYKVNNNFSVGAGISVQYIKAKLTQEVDFGSVCLGSAAAPLCPGAGLLPQAADGLAKVRGNDWSMGFNFGLLFQPGSDTRLGLAYRSRVKHQLHGRGNFRNAPALLTASGAFTPSDIEANVDLPQTISLSAFHDINSTWAVMGDVTWTAWSNFDELRVKFDNPAQPDSVVDESWNNTMRYALGVNFRPNNKLLLRAGTAFDETPIPDASHRTPRIPGEDRIWVSVGFNYKLTASLSFDVGYSHLFVDDPKIDHTDSNGQSLTGDYDASVDILSAQVNWNI